MIKATDCELPKAVRAEIDHEDAAYAAEDGSVAVLRAEFPNVAVRSISLVPDHEVLTGIAFLKVQRAFYARRVAEYDTEIAELQADRDGLYQGNEWDRKTRHINSMLRNRQSPVEEVAYYDGLIRTAEAKLDAMTAPHQVAAE